MLNIKETFEGSYTLKVNDKLASWNNKTFKISCKDKEKVYLCNIKL